MTQNSAAAPAKAATPAFRSPDPKGEAGVRSPPRPRPARLAEAAAATVANVTALTAETVRAVAKPAPAPASPISTPLPRPPEFAAIATTTVMTQAVVMAKAFGALQAQMLDHACAELKARLGEAETLARTGSAADAVALQAKAVRRSYELLCGSPEGSGADRQQRPQQGLTTHLEQDAKKWEPVFRINPALTL